MADDPERERFISRLKQRIAKSLKPPHCPSTFKKGYEGGPFDLRAAAATEMSEAVSNSVWKNKRDAAESLWSRS
jgi:hypothetical protein